MTLPNNKVDMLLDYAPSGNSYNEVLQKNSSVVATEWGLLFSSLNNLGSKVIDERVNNIQLLLKENGVAYNIYNDPTGITRPWELDPIPQIIDSTEWALISKGLTQRAKLFSLMLHDLYGPQRLIKEGIIPQQLVYMHPGFIRNCVNIGLTEDKLLTIYAADLARGDDGRLWVISDRTQAPSGYGYALENRAVMNNVLPELFASLQISPLTPFFDILQKALYQIAPQQNTQPKIVILSPGPENETFFEHSYLSLHMGITLVQGNDLMIKDNHVWLKTIEGLERVDVILRRMDDVYCDPLELKSDSVLGVPGLMQVVRKGNVTIANAIGSSIIENAGLMPFLNNAAKFLLNEDLLIPSIATWWCGQQKEMEYVIANIDRMVIRRIFRKNAGVRSAIDGAALSDIEKQNLIVEIKANPGLFTGQEKINFASSPSWKEGHIQPSHSLIRSFLVRKDDGYEAMPGGLTRSNNDKNSFIISNQSGGASKDTWVIASTNDKVQAVKLQLKYADTSPMYEKSSLPSQTAENLFWAGRYTERVINHARLFKTVMQYLMKHTPASEGLHIGTRRMILEAFTHCTYTYPGFADANDLEKEKLIENPWPIITKNLYDGILPGSLTQNLHTFVRSVYNVRSFLSLDTWRTIQKIDASWRNKKTAHQDPILMVNDIDNLNTALYAFLGMNRESSRRELEWTILDLGRKFEQALFNIRLLQSFFIKKESERTEYELISVVLESLQSRITYRYTFRDHLQMPLVFELLIFDNNYPKSLAYIIERIKNSIFSMPKISKTLSKTEMEKLIAEAQHLINKEDGNSLAQYNSNEQQYKALELLENLSNILLKIHTIFNKTYFRHTASPQQLYISSVL